MLRRGPMDLKFRRASQRSDGFVEGDICANAYGFFTLVLAIATTGEYRKRSQSAICFGDLSFEAMLKRFILRSFDFEDFFIEVFQNF